MIKINFVINLYKLGFLNTYEEITAVRPATTKVKSLEVMISSIPVLIQTIVNTSPTIIVSNAAMP